MQTYGSYRKKKRRSFKAIIEGLRLFDIVAIAVTAAAALLLLLSFTAQYINPNKIGSLALLGLISPILYVVNIVACLYWIARWKIWFAIPACALLVGIGSVPLFFRPTLSKQYQHQRQRGAVIVASSNVMGFMGFNTKDVRQSFCSTLQQFKEIDPDILCMQEFQTTRILSQNTIDTTLARMNYHAVSKVISYPSANWGLAIYSRYPIIKWGSIDFDSTSNSAMWADITIRRDTIRVFNCHLQTTGINNADKEFITEEILSQEQELDRSSKVNGIASKLIRSYRIRANQADTIAMLIDHSPHRTIVCGDFNDTPLSYAYHRVRGQMKDSFVEQGSGREITYKGLFNLFRIDHMLHSQGLATVDYRTWPSPHSDHNPVVVQMKITTHNKPKK